jgi:hypothetical protein
MSEATLGFKIDSGPAQRAAVDLDQLTMSAGKTEAAVEKLGRSSKKALSELVLGASEFAKSIQRTAEQAESFRARIDRALNVRDTFAGADRGRDIAAYGVELDRLRSKFNPLFATIQNYRAAQADIRQAHAVGAISVNEMTAALDRERTAALASIAALKGRQSALPVSRPGAVGASAFNTANLAAQFQDIAVTSAMGMSPLQIALQQGTQLSAVLGPMGASGVVKGLGAAFASLLNPVSLITIGLTAGTAALIQYFTTASSGAKDIDTILAQHAETIRALKGAYGEAAAGLKEYVAESRSTLAANARESLDATLDLVRDAAQSELSDALTLPASSFAGNINVVNQFAKAINDLEISIKSGTPDLIAYRSALSEIAVSDAASASQKALANKLRVLDEDDLKAVLALPGMLKAVSVAAGESAGGLDRLQSIDLSQTTQSVTSLGTALQTVSQTALGTASTVIDVNQQMMDSRRQTLATFEQTSKQLRTMKTELSDIQKALAEAAKTPVSEVFGDTIGQEAVGSIEAAASSIEKLFKAMDNGMPARQVHESLELIRGSLQQIGGDTKSIDIFINALINGNIRTRELESTVKSLSNSILNIPDKLVSIGIQQYTVPTADGGTKNVNVLGGNPADMSVSQYTIGGKTHNVYGGNGYIPPQQGLVDPADTQAMYETLGYGGARAAGGPVTSGQTYLVGENGPELVTMGGSGMVANTNSTASILSGGRDTLSLMEDHLYNILNEVKIHTNYFETVDGDFDTMITALQAIKSSVDASAASSGSSSTSSGSSSSSVRGYGSGWGGNTDSSAMPYNSAVDYTSAYNFMGYGSYNGTGAIGFDAYTITPSVHGPATGIKDLHKPAFATGGQIMPGEDQRVEFFKKNTERVIIVDDSKVSDGRGGQQQQNAERPISLTVNINGGDMADKRSQQAVVDQFTRAVRQAMRSY